MSDIADPHGSPGDEAAGRDALPATIGPYRILERIGQGGMGTVYAAEQRTPVARRVAVKVVQRGMATREVLARFAMERRALAAMSHRCIARVHDAGETERGEPYFVMELVEGLPLTDYCDKHRLSLEQRLKLFQQVCAGVQHAHQKGVIHRDLKPANVLVVREGDEHVPKILDFGLAKATNQDFLEATLYTQRDRILGTPEYMSPEQAAADGEVIDLRTDVYSLGVILYELLSGERPFPSEELRRLGMIEAIRLIREQDPPKPSTRLLPRADGATQYAERRRTSIQGLRRALRGDLDWIVMRALAKEPERRYESANALAVELQRYLDHEPVLAGPPSATYRAGKLLRRYRGQAIAAALVFVAVAVGGTMAYAGFRAADEQARRLGERTRDFDQLAGVVIHQRAVEEGRALFPAWPQRIAAMEQWLSGDPVRLRTMLPGLRETLAQLRQRAQFVESGRDPRFEREEDSYLYRALRALVEDADQLERVDVADVRDRRLRWARHLQALDADPDYQRAWRRARDAVASSERYAAQPIADLQPQRGLWPIGPNPVTGLWEFYHLRSAWDGVSEPTSIVAPRHDPRTGRIEVRDDTGIVFVLLPGGPQWIGAQRDDPDGPNYDPAANPDEAPERVVLEPFFLARHELTKRQWQRLAGPGIEPEPSVHGAGESLRGCPEPLGWTQPVEHVSWVMCLELLERHGLQLPTEAQWEYGCRAGTSSPWYAGDTIEALQGHANIADRTAGRYFDWNHEPTLDDGWASGPWPVGTGSANAFGLHDVHGNLRELCRDDYTERYQGARPGDGLHGDGTADHVVTRGGCFYNSRHIARAAFRGGPPRTQRSIYDGVRAARALRR